MSGRIRELVENPNQTALLNEKKKKGEADVHWCCNWICWSTQMKREA